MLHPRSQTSLAPDIRSVLAADLQQQLNARLYQYEGGSGRYQQEFRHGPYQGPSTSMPVPQHTSRSNDLLQLSQLHTSLSEHAHMGPQHHHSLDVFAGAQKPYGFGGMGHSSSVAGSGLLASAQGQEESTSRPRGGGTSGSRTLAQDLLPSGHMLRMMFPESYLHAPVGQAPFSRENVQDVPSSQAGTFRFR